jgi:hypothetical protein
MREHVGHPRRVQRESVLVDQNGRIARQRRRVARDVDQPPHRVLGQSKRDFGFLRRFLFVGLVV